MRKSNTSPKEVFVSPLNAMDKKPTNQYIVLEEFEEDKEEPIIEEEEIFQQLSDKIKAVAKKPSPSSMLATDIGEMTNDQYQEILTMIKAGHQDEVNTVDFKKYIMTNMSKTTRQFEMDIIKYKSETTKSMSYHKNKVKQELANKVKKIEESGREAQSKIDRPHNSIKKEEENSIAQNAAMRNKLAKEIAMVVIKAKEMQQELKDVVKFTTAVLTSANNVNNNVTETMTTGYNQFFNEIQDAMQDAKDNFTEWVKQRLDKVNKRENKLLDVIKEQSETIKIKNYSRYFQLSCSIREHK